MPKKQTNKTTRRTRVKNLPGSPKEVSKSEQKKVKGRQSLAVSQKVADSEALAKKIRAPGEWFAE